MQIAFRVDSSISIGTGHVMRCLVLAQWLREAGAKIVFLCRDVLGNAMELIRERQFPVLIVQDATPQHNLLSEQPAVLDWESDARATELLIRSFNEPVDWLVVDNYKLDHRWERNLRNIVGNIMVIDDFADRAHDCDVFLNQNHDSLVHQWWQTENLNPDDPNLYHGLLPLRTVKLLGTPYTLLRQEFYFAKKQFSPRQGQVNRLLVAFGGTDPTHETEKVLLAVAALRSRQMEVDVVVGEMNERKSLIEELCHQWTHVHYHCQVTNMASFIGRADLAIGSGGTSTWERCYLGLPAIVVTVAANQIATNRFVCAKGAAICLGPSEQTSPSEYADGINTLMNQPQRLLEMQTAGLKLMAGAENARSVIENIFLRDE